MRIHRAGKIRDGLWCLGRKESCVYLLEDGDESIVISGGMPYLVPFIIRQLDEFGIKSQKINKLLILHSHFDHVGIVPYFRKLYPDIRIYASSRAHELLQSQKAVKTINDFGRKATQWAGLEKFTSGYDLEWKEDYTGVIVQEGDMITIGRMHIQIFETPGHSSCSISGFVPEIKALFPSDSGGIPFQETIITSGNSNYTLFQQSLEKLNALTVNYYCADHYGYIFGEEARNFLWYTIKVAKKTRERMEKAYIRTRDIDLAARQLVEAFCSKNPEYVLPPDINVVVHRQMLRHMAKHMEHHTRCI
jgi:2-aminobenzoylacetyl-CoA thioesterase